MKLYSIYDKVSQRYFMPLLAETDGSAIRENLLFATRMKPIDDIEMYQLGDFDQETGLVTSLDNPRKVDFDSYKFPENVAKVIKQTDYERKLSEYNLKSRDEVDSSSTVTEENK